MDQREGERGFTVVEIMVAIFIVSMILLFCATAMHLGVTAIKQTNGKVTDVVHAVANDARAAVAYDGSGAQFQSGTWIENGVQITTVATSTTITIIGIDQKTQASFQEKIPLIQEAVDPGEAMITPSPSPTP